MKKWIKILIIKILLIKYKRNEASYNKMGIVGNWYTTRGIPELNKELDELVTRKRNKKDPKA